MKETSGNYVNMGKPCLSIQTHHPARYALLQGGSSKVAYKGIDGTTGRQTGILLEISSS